MIFTIEIAPIRTNSEDELLAYGIKVNGRKNATVRTFSDGRCYCESVEGATLTRDEISFICIAAMWAEMQEGWLEKTVMEHPGFEDERRAIQKIRAKRIEETTTAAKSEAFQRAMRDSGHAN